MTTLKAPLCIPEPDAPDSTPTATRVPEAWDGALPSDVGVGGGREWRPSGNLLLPAQSNPTHSSQHPSPATHTEVWKNFRKEKLLPLTDA